MRSDELEQRQLNRLRRSRALATGMLAAAAAVFAASLSVPDPGTGILLLRAVAEAALVGGLADWFAVTALFRHPLGLPIPHTAIVPANKDRIGEGLARFLDRNFLTRDLLIPELRSLQIAERLAAWLSQRENASRLAAEIVKALPYLLRAAEDSELKAFLGRALGVQLRGVALAPVLGQLMRAVTAAGYHEAVLDRALDYARDFLARNEERLLDAVTEQRRRWIPRAINREIARAMLKGAAELIDDLRNPDGAARKSLLEQLGEAAAEMSSSPEQALTLGRSGAAILRQPDFLAWVAASWQRVRDALLLDLHAPSSRLRRGIAIAIASVGEALRADPEMRERFDAMIEAVVAEALPWRGEISRFVAEVVRRWEPRTFSDRIEAAVGADLQYIRMNGTIVGGLVGGALYLVSLLAR
jgi:uncharacterized membrane-anchored protein YjiN (DUF445 family)